MLIDIIFAIIIVIACWKGFQKGLIVAVFSILAFIIGIAAALKLSSIVAGWLKNSMSISAKWLPFISFLVVFIGVVILVRLGAKLIQKTFETVMMGWANRLGGIVFYAILYIIIFSVFLFYAQQIQLLKPATIEASQTYSFIQPWGPKVIDGFGKVIPIFKDMFADLETFFGSVASSTK
jgi:membrane protein required for colicin V production